MKYSYTFKLDKKDMWKYYMVDRYSTMAGFAQIIFTVSVAILMVTKWSTMSVVLQPFCALGVLIFPVLQPFVFYMKAVKTEKPDMPDTTLEFWDDEMLIRVLKHVQHIKYRDMVNLYSKPLMLIIQPDKAHIYILPDRVTGDTKKELVQFLKSKFQ